jgi:hypothetical protein
MRGDVHRCAGGSGGRDGYFFTSWLDSRRTVYPPKVVVVSVVEVVGTGIDVVVVVVAP